MVVTAKSDNLSKFNPQESPSGKENLSLKAVLRRLHMNPGMGVPTPKYIDDREKREWMDG